MGDFFTAPTETQSRDVIVGESRRDELHHVAFQTPPVSASGRLRRFTPGHSRSDAIARAASRLANSRLPGRIQLSFIAGVRPSLMAIRYSKHASHNGTRTGTDRSLPGLMAAVLLLGVADSITGPYLALFGTDRARLPPLAIGRTATEAARATPALRCRCGPWRWRSARWPADPSLPGKASSPCSCWQLPPLHWSPCPSCGWARPTHHDPPPAGTRTRSGSVQLIRPLVPVVLAFVLYHTAMFAGSFLLPLFVTEHLKRPFGDVGLMFSVCESVEIGRLSRPRGIHRVGAPRPRVFQHLSRCPRVATALVFRLRGACWAAGPGR